MGVHSTWRKSISKCFGSRSIIITVYVDYKLLRNSGVNSIFELKFSRFILKRWLFRGFLFLRFAWLPIRSVPFQFLTRNPVHSATMWTFSVIVAQFLSMDRIQCEIDFLPTNGKWLMAIIAANLHAYSPFINSWIQFGKSHSLCSQYGSNT